MKYSLFISCPRNIEYLLESELKSLGLAVSKVSPMGVYGEADLSTLYDICLWSRLANRVQLILFSGQVKDSASMHRLCAQFSWDEVFTADKTFAVEFHGETPWLNNTMYGGQLVKDGVVDYFKEKNSRPNVDKHDPDILLHGHIKYQTLTVSLDLLGYSLHQRGYRQETGSAPLKENIAAAVLMRAKWPELLKQGYALVDPFCGSGTLLIEAAMMAENVAPGLYRADQALADWLGHDEDLWQARVDAANEAQCESDVALLGFDSSSSAVEIAQDNIATAELSTEISVQQQAVEQFASLELDKALLVCNPPYGQRLKNPEVLVSVYQAIGVALYEHCQNWRAAVLTSDSCLAKAIGLRVDKKYTLYNGALETVLYCFQLDAENELKQTAKKIVTEYTQMLTNRLNKNKKHLAKWQKRTGVNCFRLYDADLPNYAFAVDMYDDWAHVQEYAPPKDIPEAKARQRVIEMQQVLADVMEIPADHIVLKQRKRQKGSQQYKAFDRKNKKIIVKEGEAKFLVNLTDYLDTGLFLDHRLLRLKFKSSLRGKKFLNCFCYTAAFSVQAALGGAKTTNVDLSHTYLDWAEENFQLNKLNLKDHRFIRTDCTQWLLDSNDKFDVILLDPPSFSNSKSMEATLDIQRDHVSLIDSAVKLLLAEGKLYFSTNFRRFKMAEEITAKYAVKDISKQTLDEDFERSKMVRYCFEIEKK